MTQELRKCLFCDEGRYSRYSRRYDRDREFACRR